MKQQTLFTIGHSTHTEEGFLALLAKHGITAVCDLGSAPYSRISPQFNRDVMKKLLPDHGIEYLFLGRELGGRSEDPACYDDGKVQYDRLASAAFFQQGLTRRA
jgi:uncharacterized protein (DUF488 family)